MTAEGTVGRHKLFATWKNQASLAQSVTLAAAAVDAVDAADATGGLFELSVCPSMTALVPVARVCGHHLCTSPFLLAYEPARAISTSEHARECTPAEAADRHGFIRSVLPAELGAQPAAETTLLHGGSVTARPRQPHPTRHRRWPRRQCKPGPGLVPRADHRHHHHLPTPAAGRGENDPATDQSHLRQPVKHLD
jgi:triosephosphate isomerase